MAFNNGFPVGYTPYGGFYPGYYNPAQMQQAQMPPAQQQGNPFQNVTGSGQAMTPPTIHAEIIQVDNEQVAEAYPVAAGASQMMIAKDDSFIAVKTAYANGQAALDVFVKRPPAPPKPPVDLSAYVTRDEMEKRLAGLSVAYQPERKPEPETEGE